MQQNVYDNIKSQIIVKPQMKRVSTAISYCSSFQEWSGRVRQPVSATPEKEKRYQCEIIFSL